MPNLTGLNNLTAVGGKLTIQVNNYGSKLKTLAGLENLASIGGNLQINNNQSLSNCCAIHDLLNSGSIGGTVLIVANKTGCESLAAINNKCDPNFSPGQPGAGGKLSLENQGFELFPNPAFEQATVLLNHEFSVGRIHLYDLQGRLILQTELEENAREFLLDLSMLSPGSYLVRVSVDGEEFTKLLLKE